MRRMERERLEKEAHKVKFRSINKFEKFLDHMISSGLIGSSIFTAVSMDLNEVL